MLLHEAIDRCAESTPDAAALVHADRTVTFLELFGRIRSVGVAVSALTRRGERIAMVGHNDPSWVDAYYGVPLAGRVLVFLNHRLAPSELASILKRSRARVLVGSTEELERLCPTLDPDEITAISLPQWNTLTESALSAGHGAFEVPAHAGTDNEPAWLIYTSGTTGSPKGAALSHANLVAAIRTGQHGRPVADDDVYLYPFPLCHVSGYNVLRLLSAGRPVVLADRFAPDEFTALVHRHGVTSTSLAPTMLSSLLDHLADYPEHHDRLSSLRVIAYGAAPMPPSILRRAANALEVDFNGGYGMTELGGNVVFLGIDEHRRALAGEEQLFAKAGRPAPGIEIQVVDENNQALPPGRRGEIVVRAEQVMLGYWDDQETTRSAFTKGWFHTGDVGEFDEEGLLSIVDRKKDMIITGGENVASPEVEDAILRSCPELREVAVVGIPDPHWGETVCAVVVLRPGTELPHEEVITRLRAALAGFKVPRHIIETDGLPRNVSGKVMKHELRDRLVQHAELLGERF